MEGEKCQHERKTTATEQVAALLKNFGGVVVSVTVDEFVGFDGKKSSAERLGDLLPGVKVAAGFNSMYDVVVTDPGPRDKTSVFVFSDSDDAKACAFGHMGYLASMGHRNTCLQNIRWSFPV